MGAWEQGSGPHPAEIPLTPTKRKTITPPPHTELERDAPVNLENQLVSVRDREEKSRRKIESQI